MPRLRTALLAVLAVASLAAVVACRAHRPGSDAARGARGAAPGVVLVCVDTLRADEVAARLPSLAAFGRDATSFSDATAASSWTAPSVTSILTGRIPSSHGVIGARAAPALVDGVPTLAERFRDAGWSTVAATSGLWVSREAGLARGFDLWSESFDGLGAAREIEGWAAMRPADRPFFLFLHTYAAHDPYGPKGIDVDRNGEAVARAEATVQGLYALADRGRVTAPLPFPALTRLAYGSLTDVLECDAAMRLRSGDFARAVERQSFAWFDGDWQTAGDPNRLASDLRSAYERGLRYADRVCENTLRALASAHLPQGTVIAFVSDHGDAFGEHGRLGHGSDLSEEAVRVPLFVRAPGRLDPGVVAGGCGTVDVAPTLLALAGLPPMEGIDGRSLLPLARGEERGWPVVSETERHDWAAGEPVPVLRVGSVRIPQAKYVIACDASSGALREEALYDLVADPGERHALPAEEFGRYGPEFCAAVGRLRARLARFAPPAICSLR